ncbi:polyamine transporter 1 [Schizosaccharomyces cryophilus OY26]|uniref:Polyamine transporter 1 n=1 Tax=Schizosaccharomyces cryophilus (strain OY26 / ATCC MYA-4695 / CBS 11777 / NBRC 106824 / NRRL Y48691) TaxID=653667 RepID=S9X579_SCHCR|nr:polyamine transporter 1 [Schizosaccharomyces cryophilus OY26]EPY52252.1 polyamine transporter 1 [Schizosaccharomyces cryophilus OY26]
MTVSPINTSLFVCGYGCGPVVWGPLSELYGRKPPVTVVMFGFAIFNIAVAVAKDIQTIMICRFFSGFFASSPMAICAAAFADFYSNQHRGTAITTFAAIVFGGYYLPSLADLLRNLIWVGNGSILDNYFLIPVKLLFTELIVFLVTLYSSFVYGILYLLLEAYLIIFSKKRQLSMGVAELPYIGLLKAISGGSSPPLIIGAFIFPAGIFWMAWSGNYPHVHWIVPSLSGLLTGAGILLNFLNYLIDAYLFRAASAMAANTMMRSSVAAGFPLFAIQMFHNLGVG